MIWSRVAAALAAATLAGSIAGLAVGPASAGAAAKPTVSLSSTALVPGQSVTVLAAGWPVYNTTLQAMLCGANAIDGSVDCATSAAVTMSPGPDGSNNAPMQVQVPPSPCPCVVQVTAIQTFQTFKIPVTVSGAPVAPVQSRSPFAGSVHTVTLSNVHVRGGTSASSFFGGPADRILVMTIHNAGPSTVLNPVISAAWGSGPTPDHVIDSPQLRNIAPGETRTISLPFKLAALSHGTYLVKGTLSGPAVPPSFSTETSTFPWGLVIVAALVLLVLILLLVRRIRRAKREHRLPSEVEAEVREGPAEQSGPAVSAVPADVPEAVTGKTELVAEPAKGDGVGRS